MNDRDRARAALFSICPNLPYPEWFKAMCGARAAGLTVDDADSWNSPGEKYPGRQEIEKIFLNLTPDGGIGIGTLLRMAKKYGYQGIVSPKLAHPPINAGEQGSKVMKPTQNISDSVAQIEKNCESATASHPYIQNKRGLTEGVRVYRGPKKISDQNCDGALVLTYSDLDGQSLGMQFIPLQGKKVNLPGSQFIPEACLVIGGPLSRGEKAYIVEGIGHAWSAHQATRAPAVVCFGKGRMAGVAEAIHARYPNLVLIIVPDGGGQEEAAEIARAVGGLYVDVPSEWQANYDINDFHINSDSLSMVTALLESAKVPSIVEKKVEFSNRGNTLNDSGNAARLAKLHGQNIRWLPSIKKWITWNGKFWILDDDGAIKRLAISTAQTIYLETANEADTDKMKNIAKWAGTSHSLPRLDAMIELTKAELNISIPMSALDQKNMLLGTPSGVVDLTTGMLSEANPFDYITKTTSSSYQVDARCPNWEKFLERCFCGNCKLIEFIQRAVGYCLTGQTIEQVMFLLIGDGCNGKSVFLETIRAVLGDYAMQTQPETLMHRTGERASNDIARLKGARMVSVIEIEKGRRLAESFVKQLTGGDQISARFLYGEFFEFKPTFKFWLAANDKPVIMGSDHGIWRRICLIPFLVRIPPEEQDKQLSIKLAAEAAGILQWAIRGALEWQRIGLCPPSEVKKATDQYQQQMDIFRNWLDACCRQGPKESARAQPLGKSHRDWAEQNGLPPLNPRELSDRLQAYGFTKEEGRLANIYKGLSLLRQ